MKAEAGVCRWSVKSLNTRHRSPAARLHDLSTAAVLTRYRLKIERRKNVINLKALDGWEWQQNHNSSIDLICRIIQILCDPFVKF